MTDFRQSLCKIPKDLDQRGFLSEVDYVMAFLKSEKKAYNQVFDTMLGIEKFYRISNKQLKMTLPTVDKSSKSTIDVFCDFVIKRAKQADIYLEKANMYNNLNTNRVAPMRKDFDESYNKIKSELKELKSIVLPSLTDLYKSINGYDKYFLNLQQAVMAENQQNTQKALQQMDEKLARVQKLYIVFHETFSSYCERRDEVFSNIDSFTSKVVDSLLNLVKDADQIDNSLFSKNINDIKLDHINTIMVDDFWDAHDEYVEKPFAVKLNKAITYDDVSLTTSSVFNCKDSRGYDWKLEDSDGNVYLIPCNLLTPYK